MVTTEYVKLVLEESLLPELFHILPISYWSDNPELNRYTIKNKQMKGVILVAPKDNAMLPRTHHCLVYDRFNAFAFDMRYPNPTPTDVIATTRKMSK